MSERTQQEYQIRCLQWAIDYLKLRTNEVHKLNIGTYYQAILFLIEYKEDLKKKNKKKTWLENLLCDWCSGL